MSALDNIKKLERGLLDSYMAQANDHAMLTTHPLDMSEDMLKRLQVRINQDKDFAKRYRASTDYTTPRRLLITDGMLGSLTKMPSGGVPEQMYHNGLNKKPNVLGNISNAEMEIFKSQSPTGLSSLNFYGNQ